MVNISETITQISPEPLHHLTLEVVPQLMAMAQGGGEEKWNTAQVSPEIIQNNPVFEFHLTQDFAGDGWEAGWGGGYAGSFGRGGPAGR